MTKVEALEFALDIVQYEEFEDEKLQNDQGEAMKILRELIEIETERMFEGD